MTPWGLQSPAAVLNLNHRAASCSSGTAAGPRSQGVLTGWERPHKCSSPALVAGRKSYPNRFWWATVWTPNIFPCCNLSPLLTHGDQRETFSGPSCCTRAELLEPPIAGPGLGSSSNTKASCTCRVNCWAWAWEAHIASHRSARKTEKEDFGHVVPTKNESKMFQKYMKSADRFFNVSKVLNI